MEQNFPIMVSVCMITYNHEKYIAQAIESVLQQKTNFCFEILIHDDASNDNTQNIIKQYQKKYPTIIKSVLQHENQWSKGIKVEAEFLFPNAKGKYIAFCEGDDFWTDTLKLQKQFECMQANPTVSVCVHTVNCVDAEGVFLGLQIPEVPYTKNLYTEVEIVDLLIGKFTSFAHTSSLFFQTKTIKQILKDAPEIYASFEHVSDFPLKILLSTKGAFYCLTEVCSCYRMRVKNGWTAQCEEIPEKQIAVNKGFLEGLELFDTYTNKVYHNMIQKFMLQMQFGIFLREGKYKELIHKPYHELLLKKRTRTQLRVFLGCVCPALANLFRHIKSMSE